MMLEEETKIPNEEETPCAEQVEEKPEEVEVVSKETKEDEKGKKPKSKARKIIEWVLTGIFAVIFLIAAIAQVDGMIHVKDNFGKQVRFGYGTFVVQTNSMEPTYMVGTAIVTQKKSAKEIYEAYLANKIIDVTFMNGVDKNGFSRTNFESPENTSYYTLVTDPLLITHRIIEVRYYPDETVENNKYVFYAAGINTGGDYALESQYQAFYADQILGVVVLNSPVLGVMFNIISSPWGLLIFLLIPAFYLIITSVLDITKALDKKEEEAASAPSGNSVSSLDELSEEQKKKLKEEMLQQMIEQRRKKDE